MGVCQFFIIRWESLSNGQGGSKWRLITSRTFVAARVAVDEDLCELHSKKPSGPGYRLW